MHRAGRVNPFMHKDGKWSEIILKSYMKGLKIKLSIKYKTGNFLIFTTKYTRNICETWRVEFIVQETVKLIRTCNIRRIIYNCTCWKLFNKMTLIKFLSTGVFHDCFNPFQANIPFLYPLKRSENLWFSDLFRGYRKRTVTWKEFFFFKFFF